MGKVIDKSVQKQQLKRLKKAGLYKGDLRKQPTRYSKTVIAKFDDFLKGNQKVVTVKSASAARDIVPDKSMRRGRKVLVNAPPGSKVSYRSSSNTIKVKRGQRAWIVGGPKEGKELYLSSPHGITRLGTRQEMLEKLELYRPSSREYIEDNLVTLEEDEA